jgi:hypothetical protein
MPIVSCCPSVVLPDVLFLTLTEATNCPSVSSSGSGFTPDACGACGAGTLPEKWCTTLSGFGNNGTQNATALNGSWTFSYVGDCVWSAGIVDITGFTFPPFYLVFGYYSTLNTWYIGISGGPSFDGGNFNPLYQLADPINCDGSTTLDNSESFGAPHGAPTAVVTPC